jgi:hypothetical protein
MEDFWDSTFGLCIGIAIVLGVFIGLIAFIVHDEYAGQNTCISHSVGTPEAIRACQE